MKKQYNLIFELRTLLVFLLVISGVQLATSQDAKKEKVRLKTYYEKVMNDGSYINITAAARVNKQNVDVADINLIIYNETDDESVKLGEVTTGPEGKAKFKIDDLKSVNADSSGIYNFKISFKGNDDFKKASKSLSIKDAKIEASVFAKDSTNFVKATIYDVAKDSVLPETLLDVQVQRLFKSLKIGKEFNYTDNNGTVVVPIQAGIPGVDGKLIIEVVLKDSDDYGTVKALVEAPTETVVTDQSTFDKRTLWGPRNKTPYFILIFTNVLIIGVWGFLLYLVLNLFKIYKSKIN